MFINDVRARKALLAEPPEWILTSSRNIPPVRTKISTPRRKLVVVLNMMGSMKDPVFFSQGFPWFKIYSEKPWFFILMGKTNPP